ncbi:uncharacterized protein BO66DRAFT_126695 [Aspergillus aculeatinus CBS 121060]|uniref:Uncharacterized protein n=1 Tax=Aspergillus aculeatinus CBS 121060 TaxID=1448322 RepID=A0ACD1H4W6_9EURO|nr:hypothetical protein BO66DRAFT_126695 [Aspergillus aculeatinus CBS 121060]RAH68560.1 hypothetical protein BO66DRAFT_126695 [Aspergillus aculeatinus CBS 121060]
MMCRGQIGTTDKTNILSPLAMVRYREAGEQADKESCRSFQSSGVGWCVNICPIGLSAASKASEIFWKTGRSEDPASRTDNHCEAHPIGDHTVSEGAGPVPLI